MAVEADTLRQMYSNFQRTHSGAPADNMNWPNHLKDLYKDSAPPTETPSMTPNTEPPHNPVPERPIEETYPDLVALKNRVSPHKIVFDQERLRNPKAEFAEPTLVEKPSFVPRSDVIHFTNMIHGKVMNNSEKIFDPKSNTYAAISRPNPYTRFVLSTKVTEEGTTAIGLLREQVVQHDNQAFFLPLERFTADSNGFFVRIVYEPMNGTQYMQQRTAGVHSKQFPQDTPDLDAAVSSFKESAVIFLGSSN